jgi:hypothetical protein
MRQRGGPTVSNAARVHVSNSECLPSERSGRVRLIAPDKDNYDPFDDKIPPP